MQPRMREEQKEQTQKRRELTSSRLFQETIPVKSGTSEVSDYCSTAASCTMFSI
jgi:hypothetical protein